MCVTNFYDMPDDIRMPLTFKLLVEDLAGTRFDPDFSLVKKCEGYLKNATQWIRQRGGGGGV